MYSLGIIFFEMWCAFGTMTEKDKALTLLKTKNIIDPIYEKNIPPKVRMQNTHRLLILYRYRLLLSFYGLLKNSQMRGHQQ